MTGRSTENLELLVNLASKSSGQAARPADAFYQDLQIAGDDVDELLADIACKFALPPLNWSRFFDLNEPPRYIWGKAREWERLTIAHLAAVIDRGEWLEP